LLFFSPRGAEPVESLADFGAALPKKGATFRFFTQAASRPFFPVFGVGDHAEAGTKDVVVWVDDEAAVAEDLKAKCATRLAKTESGVLVRYAAYPAAVRKRLHGARGVCRGCIERP